MNSISRLIVKVHIGLLMAICRNVKEYLFNLGGVAAGYRKQNQNKVVSSYTYTHVQLPALRLVGERCIK